MGVAMEWRHMTAIRRVTLTSSLLETVDISSNESTDVKEGWQVGRGPSQHEYHHSLNHPLTPSVETIR